MIQVLAQLFSFMKKQRDCLSSEEHLQRSQKYFSIQSAKAHIVRYEILLKDLTMEESEFFR